MCRTGRSVGQQQHLSEPFNRLSFFCHSPFKWNVGEKHNVIHPQVFTFVCDLCDFKIRTCYLYSFTFQRLFLPIFPGTLSTLCAALFSLKSKYALSIFYMWLVRRLLCNLDGMEKFWRAFQFSIVIVLLHNFSPVIFLSFVRTHNNMECLSPWLCFVKGHRVYKLYLKKREFTRSS